MHLPATACAVLPGFLPPPRAPEGGWIHHLTVPPVLHPLRPKTELELKSKVKDRAAAESEPWASESPRGKWAKRGP